MNTKKISIRMDQEIWCTCVTGGKQAFAGGGILFFADGGIFCSGLLRINAVALDQNESKGDCLETL